MKHGKYFRIPESPIDLESLWDEAQPLTATTLPTWLAAEDANYYRYLSCSSIATTVTGEHNGYMSELKKLEAAGLMTHRDAQQASIHHLYVPAPNEDVWSIGIYSGHTPLELQPRRGVHNPVMTREQIADVHATFVADPFMIQTNGAWSMFFEVMNWESGKGEIGLAQSRDGYDWTYQKIVLAEPFHLSYPYVFEWQGEYYLIPESYQAASIRLYRAETFPTRWSLVAQLIGGAYLVDPSIFRHDGLWWLFAETNPNVKHDCLRLFFADELTGPWIEHPKSPVINNDARIARPAGRVLSFENHIFRLAQDCSVSYGSGVRAFKITDLTTSDYAEEEASSKPLLTASGHGWNADGMHHIDAHPVNEGQWIACVDGRRAAGAGRERVAV